MSEKRHTAAEIVAKLRQVDVLTAQVRTMTEAIRQIGVTEVTRTIVGAPTTRVAAASPHAAGRLWCAPVTGEWGWA